MAFYKTTNERAENLLLFFSLSSTAGCHNGKICFISFPNDIRGTSYKTYYAISCFKKPYKTLLQYLSLLNTKKDPSSANGSTPLQIGNLMLLLFYFVLLKFFLLNFVRRVVVNLNANMYPLYIHSCLKSWWKSKRTYRTWRRKKNWGIGSWGWLWENFQMV